MFHIVFVGFFYSFIQNIAIGMQGAFVLRNGLLKNRVFLSCLICCLCDAFLISIGVFCVSGFIKTNPIISFLFKKIGFLVLLYYSLSSFKKAFYSKSYYDIKDKVINSKKNIITVGIIISILNPQALTDTIVVLSTLCMNYSTTEKVYFFIGSAFSSFVWFFTLGFLAKFFSRFFNKKIFWKILDLIIGFLMLILSIRVILM